MKTAKWKMLPAMTAVAATLWMGLPCPKAMGYGKDGHETVGAVADILIKGSNAETHVKALLGTQTLEQVSTWADEVKHGPFTKETKDFAERNPNHSGYHYTDIPLQEKVYNKNSVGAEPFDVVQTILVCIKVLESGKDSPTMTQVEALKVLAHLVGDVHQPLHVGAAYLDADGTLVLPKTKAEAKTTSTVGGNNVKFGSGLHSYWDDTAVKNAMKSAGASSPGAFAVKLTKTPPVGWKPNSFMSQWGTAWANEMMPLANKAYTDLSIKKKSGKVWPATAKDATGYKQFAAQTVNDCLARGGYRLAAVLKKIWP